MTNLADLDDLDDSVEEEKDESRGSIFRAQNRRVWEIETDFVLGLAPNDRDPVLLCGQVTSGALRQGSTRLGLAWLACVPNRRTPRQMVSFSLRLDIQLEIHRYDTL